MSLFHAINEFPRVTKSQMAEGSNGKTYNYADLTSVMNATTEILKKYNLFVSFIPETTEKQLIITMELNHTNGYFRQYKMQLNCIPDLAYIQHIGSCITYLKRYIYCSVLNICADNDDDGKTATKARKSNTIISENKKENKSEFNPEITKKAVQPVHEEKTKPVAKQPVLPKPPVKATVCTVCGKHLTKDEDKISSETFGKRMCRECMEKSVSKND